MIEIVSPWEIVTKTYDVGRIVRGRTIGGPNNQGTNSRGRTVMEP